MTDTKTDIRAKAGTRRSWSLRLPKAAAFYLILMLVVSIIPGGIIARRILADDYAQPFDALRPPSEGAVFLPCDTGEPETYRLTLFPAGGYFMMDGERYHRGARTNNSAHNAHDGVLSHSIYGRGFTRLSGVFGRTGGTGTVVLVVQADGRYIFGHAYNPLRGPERLDIALPEGAEEIRIRLQVSGNGTNAGFGDIYFIVDDTPPPQPGNEVFLPCDLRTPELYRLSTFPASGSFVMGEERFFRGVSTNNNAHNAHDGVLSHSIYGRGFTRLSGVFGRTSGTGTVMLVVQADGRYIYGHVYNSLRGAELLNIPIPVGTEEIRIRLQISGNGTNAGIGNIYFIVDDTPPPPPHDEVFLHCDIRVTELYRLSTFPASGSFSMSDERYFRGVSTNNNAHNAHDGALIQNIYGRGFTRLSGEFGRSSGTGTVVLVVQADDRYIYGHVYNPLRGPELLDIPIPVGTEVIRIRLQVIGNGTNAGFGNIYFIVDDTPPPPHRNEIFLPCDTRAPTLTGLAAFPASGSFVMGEERFFRGVRTNNSSFASNDGTLTLNALGQEFIRLSGVFGRSSGTGTGVLEIQADGRLILEHEYNPLRGAELLNVDIPADTEVVVIRMHITGSGTNFGFGNMYFISAAAPPPPPPPPTLPGDVNGDGTITAADVGRLRAYLAGFPVDIVRENADITGTGTITAADVGMLRAYLAGFDVVLGPPNN